MVVLEFIIVVLNFNMVVPEFNMVVSDFTIVLLEFIMAVLEFTIFLPQVIIVFLSKTGLQPFFLVTVWLIVLLEKIVQQGLYMYFYTIKVLTLSVVETCSFCRSLRVSFLFMKQNKCFCL